MPPEDYPESVDRPGTTTTTRQADEAAVAAAAARDVAKPPVPSLSFCRRREESIDIQLPHVIAGCLVAAFANTLADRLGNALLTYYYIDDQKVPVNLDRVFDRLMTEFTGHIWDELWDFYYASNPQHGRQLSLLFDGPIRQMVLVLNGPELSRCVLDKIAPGLSQRPTSWTQASNGIDIHLALQVVCRWWDTEKKARSPGGNPDDIARTIGVHLLNGKALAHFVRRIRTVLYSPHHVQMHLMESAAWDILLKRRMPPPTDGYHVLQFRFECDPRQRIMEQGHLDVGAFPAVTGTAGECVATTIDDYATKQWPRCSRVVIGAVQDALRAAAQSSQQGQGFAGMSFWDDSDPDAVLSPGLRLLHVEIEEGMIRLSTSAWLLAFTSITQLMAWLCATLSSSPFPEAVSECCLQITHWEHTRESTFISCSLAHRAVPAGEGVSWLHQRRGVVVVPGFPIEEHVAGSII